MSPLPGFHHSRTRQPTQSPAKRNITRVNTLTLNLHANNPYTYPQEVTFSIVNHVDLPLKAVYYFADSTHKALMCYRPISFSVPYTTSHLLFLLTISVDFMYFIHHKMQVRPLNTYPYVRKISSWTTDFLLKHKFTKLSYSASI